MSNTEDKKLRPKTASGHVITVESETGYRTESHRGVCSCGGYATKRLGSPKKALSAGADHVRAMSETR